MSLSSSSSFSSYPPMQQVKTDYDPHIIKPPDRNKTHGNISRHIVIDSRDRDYLKYPDSNKYRVDIPQEFKDIISIELTLAQIPNTFYNINSSNNTFYLNDGNGIIYTIYIPEGQYNNELLIDTLNGKYGDLFMSYPGKLNFTRDPINLKLRIQSNRSNNLDFIYNINYSLADNCSPCRFKNVDRTIGFINRQFQSAMIDLSDIEVMGIIPTGSVSDQDYTIYKMVVQNNVDLTSIFRKNDYFILNDPVLGKTFSCQVYELKNDRTLYFEELDGEDPSGATGFIFQNISILESPYIYQIENKPYVILKIKDFNNINSIGSSNNSYTVIPLLNLENTILNQATVPVHGVIKYFNPPLSKLYWLDIEFLNYDGSLFDFRGQENMLMMTVSLLNQPGKYNNYVESN